MNILFVHQNLPGQFRHLAPALAQDPANGVVFLTQRENVVLPGVRTVLYKPRREAGRGTHHYLRLTESSVLRGQEVARACLKLARESFRPDIIIAHPGWGESLFLKDVFPTAPLLSYCEFYYLGRGADAGFDPEFSVDLDTLSRIRTRAAHLLLGLDACDRGLSLRRPARRWGIV